MLLRLSVPLFLFTEGEIFYDQEQYKHDNQDIKDNEG